MSEFKSFDAKVEVLGEVIMAFVDGFPPIVRNAGLKILEKHAIHTPQPGQFYSLQSLLDAMSDVST